MTPYQIFHLSLYLNTILVVLIFLILLFLKSEGRFHLSRAISKGGLDLISRVPESGALKLRKLNFTGEHFQSGNEAIFFNFDPLLYDKNNEDKEERKRYNDLLSKTSHWAGSKRPVVFASELVSFITNPGMNEAIEQARSREDFDKVGVVLDNLKNVLNEQIVKVSFLMPFQIDNLREYLNSGSTPMKVQNTYMKGKLSGILQMTQKRDLSKVVKFALPIGMMILILILWQSGAFDDLLSTFKR